jgi:hypothetical protein
LGSDGENGTERHRSHEFGTDITRISARLRTLREQRAEAAMNLFHYTVPENAFVIGLGGGLKPRCKEENQWQTMGLPVVWLTKEKSNLATEAEAQRYAAVRDDLAKVGESRYGGPLRCQVEIARSKHVMRYGEFLRTTELVTLNPEGDRYRTGRDVLRTVEAEPSGAHALASWWISTREIPASKIWVPLTCAQAIAACEWHIKTHPTADARERFKQQRDTFAAEPADMIFVLHGGECRRWQEMEREP